jgi:hypothetical protein
MQSIIGQTKGYITARLKGMVNIKSVIAADGEPAEVQSDNGADFMLK